MDSHFNSPATPSRACQELPCTFAPDTETQVCFKATLSGRVHTEQLACTLTVCKFKHGGMRVEVQPLQMHIGTKTVFKKCDRLQLVKSCGHGPDIPGQNWSWS